MGVAAIVLGPWAAIVAISIALAIQAICFGDGGITTLGANCFNMAIVGSLVAYGIYRLAAWRAPLCSARRVAAAGLAGYLAINAAALCAAIEFGIQPLLFRDATGAPLYAPYPLHIAIPAMLIGHLTLAGLSELVISSGIVAYLQRGDAALLRPTAPDAPKCCDNRMPGEGVAWAATRQLWLALAALLILTPVGILAVGSAWGEWSARDFTDVQMRRQIAAASQGQVVARVPRGLERLSALWTAPLPRYAPSMIRSQAFGYLLSAMVGVGLIIALVLLGSRLAPRVTRARLASPRRSFIERTARGLLATAERAFFDEDLAANGAFLQRLDPRVKLVGLGVLMIVAVAVRRLGILAALLAGAVALALVSRIPIRLVASRIWLTVLGFTGVIALPALFLTPGASAFRLPWAGWPVTGAGLRAAAFLILRAETAATFSLLLVVSTLWTRLLHALRYFRTPVVVVAILGMTYRYMFLFLATAYDMFESRESRMVGILAPPERRRLAAASAGVLLSKTLQLSGEVHMAMQARGFVGEMRLLEEPRMPWLDWLRLAGFVAVGAAALWLGR
jgi:cobalt/nickel transport system permease protein